ncbi:MAG: DNRLRE domain-containing protein [Nanoarchaeota archaeon]
MTEKSVLFMIVLMVCTAPALAFTYTLALQDADTETFADTMLREWTPDENYGTEPYILFSSSPDYQRFGMYKFDLSQLYPLIDDAFQIGSAELYLYAYEETFEENECVEMSAHHAYSYPSYQVEGLEWDELSVTWGNRPVLPSEYNPAAEDTGLFCDGMALNEWLPFNVTGMVRQEFSEGDMNVSIYMMTSEIEGTSPDDLLRVRSKESYFSDVRPFLLITYEAGGNDVAVTDFSKVYPSNPVVGNNILFEFRLSNLGTEDLENVYYRVATRGEPPHLYNSQPISLDAGDFIIVYENWRYSNPGIFYPEVVADYGDTIAEFNESNNYRNLMVQVGSVLPFHHHGGKLFTMMEGGSE